MTTAPTTLDEWLDYQQRVHPREIELGLDRVRTVWQSLDAPHPAATVISVGGTNGKGSTVAFLEAMLVAAGKRVGAFTSPHLLRYNERIRVAGVDASDDRLIEAFTRIEHARGAVPLTYFEFGTLAALLVFAESTLDVALLEVGLGGRLDAVNVIDADAAIVTTVDLDHQSWLGDTRDAIGREKAGIFRKGRPAIIGDADAPAGLLDAAQSIGADVIQAGLGYAVEDIDDATWSWRDACVDLTLPHPRLPAPCQLANAAAAIAALRALQGRLGWQSDAITQGCVSARIAARLQTIATAPELIVDVAHNPQAARALAEWLLRTPARGRTFAVYGALDDKDVAGVFGPLSEFIDEWFLCGLDSDSPRGLAAAQLRARLSSAHGWRGARLHADVSDALDAAIEVAAPQDRVLVFGSFFVAARALEWSGRHFATA